MARNIIIWLILSMALVSQRVASASEITINDDMQSCFGCTNVVNTYTLKNGKYTSKKDKSISRAALVELVKAIQESKSFTAFSPEALGITPESVKQHHDELLKSTIFLKSPIYKKISIEDYAELSYPEVCKHAKDRLTYNDASTTHVNFTMKINAPEVNAEKIELSSFHDAPYMLPWNVKVGNQSWETYSLEIPKKLFQLSDKAGFCAPLLNGKKYWQEDFWTDHIFWSMHVGSNLEQRNCQKYLKLLSGFTKADKLYTIKSSQFGSINFHPDSIFTELEFKKSKSLDSCSWWNYFKNEMPTADWHDFNKMTDRCEQVVGKRKWLMNWKNSKPTNKLHCEFAGTNYYSERDLNEYVMPAWLDAGLKGKPEFEIRLNRSDSSGGKIFLSSIEPRTLVLDAAPRKGNHWFDKLQVSFHPKIPNYIIIHLNGKIEKRKISATSKYLPKWARDAIKEGNFW